ncbi:MAG: hypothetical protein AB7G13_22390 [Lautropia sp.]
MTPDLGDPPEWLPDRVRIAWQEIAAAVAPGVLQRSDRLAVELLATLLTEFRADPVAFGSRKYTVLQTLLTRCGMTPADRARIVVPPPAPPGGKPAGLAGFRK